MSGVLGQYFARRAQRQREAEWQAIDAESVRWAGILTDLPHIRDIRRRAIDNYVQNGGDLHALHRQAALDMSRRFLAMELMLEPSIPYVVHRARYPEHECQLTLEWLRGRRRLALTSERHREELRRMRDAPPAPLTTERPPGSTRPSRIGYRTAHRATWLRTMVRRRLSSSWHSAAPPSRSEP